MRGKPIVCKPDDIICNLRALAEEKESVRSKLEITAGKLATTAKEEEIVKLKLATTAKKLKRLYEMLEKRVFSRTKELEMSHAKEKAILLSIGDGLIVTDKKGTVTVINKVAEKLLETKSSNVIGKNFSKVSFLFDEEGVPFPLKQHPIMMALKAHSTTTPATNSAYYHIRKNKTRFPVAITATPVTLNGKIIGAIKVFRDITYEREIDKTKTEFVALASHQLRTPLSSVNWYAEMLLAGDAGKLNEKQKKYLDEIYLSNQRMVELVNALLNVSNLELGTFPIVQEKTDICALTESVVSEQMPHIDAKKIGFYFRCDEAISFIQADPKLLRMIMQNILSNSIKYTPEHGKIDFSISLSNKHTVLIKISDTGYGIPKNQQDKIFTKLFRADNVKDKDTNGTGLGLYIVKSIVESSGGKIWFFSPKKSSIGRKSKKYPGTTFYVALPLNGIKKNN